MGQHFTLGAAPAQIMGQHMLPRPYGCHCLCSVVKQQSVILAETPKQCSDGDILSLLHVSTSICMFCIVCSSAVKCGVTNEKDNVDDEENLPVANDGTKKGNRFTMSRFHHDTVSNNQ